MTGDKLETAQKKKRVRVYTEAQKERHKELEKINGPKYRAKHKEEINARAKAYRDDNRELITIKNRERYHSDIDASRQKCKKYRDSNIDLARERDRARYAANRDLILQKAREKTLKNPGSRSHFSRNRKARIRNADGSHTGADISILLIKQRGVCASCPAKLEKSGKNKYHVDHIMPLSRGGSNDKYNLQCLCPSCNLRKHAKDPFDWAKQNGKLL